MAGDAAQLIAVKQLTYLRTLLGFAFRENPLLYLCIGISIFSVATEIAAMVGLLPLISIAAGQPAPPDAFIVRAAQRLGIDPTARVLLLIFVGLFSVRIVTQFASQGLTSWLSKRLLAQLGTQAFATLVRSVPIRQVEQTTMGSYMSLVGDQSFRASTVIASLNQVFSLGLLAVLYFIAVWHYSPPVGLAVLVFLAVGFILLRGSFRVSNRLGARQIEQSAAANSVFLDALNGLKSVRALSAESYVSEAYRKQIWDYIRTLTKVDLVSMFSRLGPALLLLAAVAAAAMWPGGAALSPELPFTVTIVIFLMRFFPVIGQLLQVGLRVAADTKAGRDVTHLVEPETPSLARHAAQVDVGSIEHIEFRRLSFSHRPDRPVLRNMSFRLERGKSYALIGVSGSGKSTILDLMLDFYPVDTGLLLINGKPIDSLVEEQLRRRVLLVSQNVSIFNDTLANNIRFGLQATNEDIVRACRIAGADEFVRGLPQGYDTLLTYQGGNLSGGQRQRLGIARAVLRLPEVLLLDECTSALDAATRDQLVENLLAEFSEGILFFVTHDAHIRSRVDHVLDISQLNRLEADAA
jgi:ABC-type bacteriocin/lantibiotic exporter with double-glycine peptidase domain